MEIQNDPDPAGILKLTQGYPIEKVPELHVTLSSQDLSAQMHESSLMSCTVW